MSKNISEEDVAILALQTVSGIFKIRSLVAPNEDPVFIDDVVEITGYAKATIYSFINKKLIPFHKAAGRRRLFFYKSELLAWMENKTQEVPNA